MAAQVTNGPDQLKTRIQNGEFRTLPEALKWQLKEGGGIKPLYGRAALFRAFYTGHGVLAVNFMRSKVTSAASEVGRPNRPHSDASPAQVEHVIDASVGNWSPF